MADAVFPPGGPGVKYPAANGITYVWDVDNNRWTVESVTKKRTATVAVQDDAPEFPAVGDLWYDTTDPNGGKMNIYVDSDFEQPSPSYLEHTELQDRVALLENTSEILNEFKCVLTNSTGGSKPGEGEFKTANTNPQYVNKIRINGKDKYSNPLPIIHVGDGLELLHEENGHSHRFKVTSQAEGPYGDGDLEIGTQFIGGDLDGIKSNDHYLFRFHTPHTDVDEFAHLDKDQTFTGVNTFDGDVVFTGNVTLPDADGDGDGDAAPTLDGDNTFTGNNIFAKTTFKSDDDTHRLYMKDKDNNVNLTIFPTGNISSKGNLSFTAKGNDTFANLYSSRIKVSPADGWDSNSDGDFGFYIDIGAKNSFKSRFIVGGRGGREKAFEVYDDGEGVAKVYGSLRTNNKANIGGNITANGDVEIRASLGADSNITSTELGKKYLITAVDISQTGAATAWLKAGALNLNVGSVFTCISNETLPTGNTVQEYLGDNHLNVAGDISAGGEISGDDIEGHTFLFSGDGAVQGNISLEDVTLNGTMSVDGAIDLSNATVFNNAPIPKKWFTKVLKEFAGEFKSIYVNEETNGTSDPAIQIKAGTTQNSNILIQNNSGATQFVVNVAQRYAFGGTSSNPWLAQYNHHFTTKKYVDDAVSVGGISWGLQFNYTNTTNNMGTGKFTMQNQSGTFKLIISETTTNAITWYDNGDMALKSLDFETAGGPGPMYTVRSVDDPTKIMRQGYLKAIQYTGNTFTGIFDGASQINTGSMTVGSDYYITIGGLF